MKIERPLCLLLAATAAFLLVPALAAAQTPAAKPAAPPAAAPAANSAVGAISLPVTIVNDKGDPVKNLTPASVTLTDNGHQQTVQAFAPAPPAPMVIGLLGQTTTNLRTELGDERLASVHFVDHTIPGTDDKFFVVDFAHEVDLLEDPTASQNKLHDAINQLGSPQFGNQSGSSSGDQSSGQHSGNGNNLYDAIYLASTEVFKQQPGRHILIVITDGVDHGSKEGLSDAVEAAQSANAMVFAIYYKGEEERQNNPNQNTGRHGGGFPGGGGGYPGGGGGYPGGGGGYPGGGGGYPGGGGRRGGGQTPTASGVDGKKILEQICTQTGGYMVEGKRDKADEAYNKLADLLKNQFLLTWTPDKESSSSSYHHLSLTTKEKGVYPLVQQNYTAQP